MQLSEHFTLDGFTFSQTAVRRGFDNTPNDQQIQNMRALCRDVPEPRRSLIHHPLQISSGYRSPKGNAAIGGSTTSQHMESKAADLACPALGTIALLKAIVRSGIVFDQLVFGGTWVHISHNPPRDRQQILVAKFRDGRADYTCLTKEATLAIA